MGRYNKKYVLAVGAGAEQVHSIRQALDLGLHVVAVDGNPNAAGFADASEHITVDIKNCDKVLSIANQYDIVAVIPSCIGRYITTVGYVNENFAGGGSS